MSMGIGTNTQKPDEGELKRKMKEQKIQYF